jgi:uncharacterized SAM-binding protein YcdF (DUF218 family)
LGLKKLLRRFAQAISNYLVVNDELKKADLIAVMAGGLPERAKHAAVLYKAELAPRIVLFGGGICEHPFFAEANKTWAELGADMLSDLDVPNDDIIFINEGYHTFEEVRLIRDFMIKRKYRSVIIVSSPYHMRRLKLTVKKVFRGQNITSSLSSATKSWFKMDTWWRSEWMILCVIIEYIKLLYYHLKKLA